MEMNINFEAVYRQYEPKVNAYIRNHVNSHEDAKDLCADVFLKLMQKQEELREMPDAISSRIFLITKSRVIDYYRTKHYSEEIPETITDGSDIEEETIHTETLERLADALEQLDERLRDIIVLHYYEGKKLTEIAEAMGMSYRNMNILHQKALAQLRQKLA